MLNACDNKEIFDAILLVLSMAFDGISHDPFIVKLKEYSFDQNALNYRLSRIILKGVTTDKRRFFVQ